MLKKIFSITAIVLATAFIFMAARAVISLEFELIDVRGYGAPPQYEVWALIVLAPLLLVSVSLQSYFLLTRYKKDHP